MHLLFAALLAWNSWNASAVVNDRGYPVFTVDGKPFFVYGAAFFYERIPRANWRGALASYRQLGINTIDLYVIWNWHEPQPGIADFDGHTNPRRDLRGLLKIVHELGYKVILRPGPVIRNEWRNGGYPWWLLERPEYNMPLHDVLEGRYPATATYQNAHADAAANEWLHNATHLRESARWLRAVLREVAPWSHDVIAIALDDDQGAYPDNDTWPAPHWHTYIGWLKSVVQSSVGTKAPLFINTWQMKVTASSPVWAWGDQYLNDTYSIGAHDIDQLALSTGLLQTQTDKPVMLGEFQAGWLQGADQVSPTPADPSNTTLALHELLQLGVRGVVNFPVQDTVYPAGWEAPWANRDYAWDAAFGFYGETDRFFPTKSFGDLVGAVPQLPSMHAQSDVDVAWLTSAYDSALMTNQRVAAIADATLAQLRLCRALALTCRLVDLRFDSALGSQRRLVLPPNGIPLRFDPIVERRLTALRKHHFSIASTVSAFSRAARANGGVADAALLIDSSTETGLFDVFNASNDERRIPATTVHVGGRAVRLPPLVVAARSATDVLIPRQGQPRELQLFPLLKSGVIEGLHVHFPPTGRAGAREEDFYNDGSPTFVLQNDDVRAVISADAGGRAFDFDDMHVNGIEAPDRFNAFTSIGAARDDVRIPLPPSARDYIAAYTHPIAAGTFNRPYDCRILDPGPQHARLRCTYEAPDLAPTPVRFTKTFELDPNSRTLTIETSASADAISLSAVTDKAWLTIDCRDCDVSNAGGDRLVRVRVKAGETQTIGFTIQEPPSPGPIRP